MRFDDPLYDRQAKPSSFMLRREEGGKDLLLYIGSKATALIPDFKDESL